MSRVVNGVIIIEPTADSKCEICGKVDELRPYGANGENICFECGMKDEEVTNKKLEECLFGKAKAFNPNNN